MNLNATRDKSRWVIATGVAVAMFAGQLEFAGAAHADVAPTYTVNTCLDTFADDGLTSLREAVNAANIAAVPDQVISFDAGISCNGTADATAVDGHPLVLDSSILITVNRLTIDGLGKTTGAHPHYMNDIVRGYSNATSPDDESNWYVDETNSILYQEVYYSGPLFFVNGSDADFNVTFTGLKIDGNGDNFMGRAIEIAPQAAPSTAVLNVTNTDIVNNRLGVEDSCTDASGVTPPTIPDFTGIDGEYSYNTICVTYVDADRLHASGAAILAQSVGTSVHLTDASVSNNFAKGLGAAIVADRVTVTNSLVYQNTAYSDPNQAIVRGGGAILALNQVTVTGSDVVDNKIIDGYGGAIAVAGKFDISNSNVQNNSANPDTTSPSPLNQDLAPQSMRVGFGGAISSNIFTPEAGWARFDGQHLPTSAALESDDPDAEIWIADPDGDMSDGTPFIDPELLAANDVIDSSTFDNNAATNGDGGAVYGDGNLDVTTSAEPTTSFTNNNAKNGHGGALAIRAALNVSDAQFATNNAIGTDADHGAGGAIHASGTTSIVRSTFSSNTSYLDGGAVFSTYTAPLTVSQSQFNSNTSSINGGAISANDSLSVEKSTFDENSATGNGGAFAVYSFTNAVNNTFYKNVSNGQGGAAYVWNDGSAALDATIGSAGSHFVNNTFRGNTALASAGDSIFSTGDTSNVGTKVLIAIANIFAADTDGEGDQSRVQCASQFNDGWSAYTDWQFNIATDNSCGAAAATIGADPGPAAPNYLSTNVVDTVDHLTLLELSRYTSQPDNTGYATTIALGISSSAVNVFFKFEDTDFSAYPEQSSLPWVQTSATFTEADRDLFVPTVDERDTVGSSVSRDSNLAGPRNTGQIPGLQNSMPQHDVGAYEFTSGTPKAETNEATVPVRNTTATVNGVVDPYRLISSDASFYYTKDQPSPTDLENRCTDALVSGWSKKDAAQSPVYGYSDQNVSADLTSLAEDTTYYFCVHVTTDSGNMYGFIKQFKTELSTAETNSEADSVRNTTATVTGAVKPFRTLPTPANAAFYYTKVAPSDLESRCSDELVAGEDWQNQSVSETTSVSGDSEQSVSADLTGLDEDTTYYFCVFVTTDVGNKYGHIGSFTTGLSSVETDAASSVTDASATLNGTIKPYLLEDGTASFYYTTTEPSPEVLASRCSDELLVGDSEQAIAPTGIGWTQIAADQSPVSGDSELSISAVLTPVAANTQYWFCAQSQTNVGNKYGFIQSFSNAKSDAVVQTRAATNITDTTATIHGWITPNSGASGDMKFRYTTDIPVNPSDPCNDADAPANAVQVDAMDDSAPGTSTGSGSSKISVHADLSGLTINTTYYFCVYFDASGIRTPGGSLTFITNASAPDVITTPATLVGNHKARINGSVNPHTATVSTLEFHYKRKDIENPLGISTCNEGTPGVKTIVAIPGKEIVSGENGISLEFAELTGLMPGETYEYCIAMASSGYQVAGVDEMVYGDVYEFTTGPEATALTKAATGISLTGGQFNGTVDPQLIDSSTKKVKFRYSLIEPTAGQTCENMVEATDVDATPSEVTGTDPVDVSYTLTGGTAGDTYYYCVLMESPTETVYGATYTLVLDPTSPIAVTDPSQFQSFESALLDGTVDPKGRASTSMKFYWSIQPLTQENCTTDGTEVQAYVPATTSTNADPEIALIENTLASTKTNVLGNGNVAVSAYLDQELQPATTYFYCVYIRTGTGANMREVVGNIQSFTTQNLHMVVSLELNNGGLKGAVASTEGDGMLPNTDPTVSNCYPEHVDGDVYVDGELIDTPNLDSPYCDSYTTKLYQYSRRTLVGTFAVNENGEFTGEYVIPACPTPGVHRFVVEGTAPDGSTVSKSISFIVDPTCKAPNITKDKNATATIQLQDILFPNYKSILTKTYKKRLRAYASLLKDAKHLTITGYTETKQPSRAARLACIILSGNRAKAVRSYLRSLGVKIKYITIARGATNPVSVKKQARNRRVTLRFTIDYSNSYNPAG